MRPRILYTWAFRVVSNDFGLLLKQPADGMAEDTAVPHVDKLFSNLKRSL
jgi:hypothetical protein